MADGFNICKEIYALWLAWLFFDKQIKKPIFTDRRK